METQRRQLSIFLSYSRKVDAALAEELAASLSLLEFSVHRDSDVIRPTEAWQAKLDDAVTQSAVFLLLLSPQAAKSVHCEREWMLADAEHKKFIVVRTNRIEDHEVPALLTSRQHIDHSAGRSFGVLLRAVVEAIRVDSDWLGELNRLSSLAREWRRQRTSDKRFYTLSGSQIEKARQWRAAWPEGQPEPPAIVLDFMAASEKEDLRRRRVRTLVVTVFAGQAIAVGTLGYLAHDLTLKNTALNDVWKVDAQSVLASISPAPAPAPAPTEGAAPATAPEPVSSTRTDALQTATLEWLVGQFNSLGRRDASDELVRRYRSGNEGERARITKTIIDSVQSRSRLSGYRVNLYVLVTLARMPSWQGDTEQRNKVEEASRMFDNDPTYQGWAVRARGAASPPLP